MQHADLFLYLIFAQRPINDGKIGRSYGRCIGLYRNLAKSIEILISQEKESAVTDSSLPKIYKVLKPFDSRAETVWQEW